VRSRSCPPKVVRAGQIRCQRQRQCAWKHGSAPRSSPVKYLEILVVGSALTHRFIGQAVDVFEQQQA
jgi:hypothetical protein